MSTFLGMKFTSLIEFVSVHQQSVFGVALRDKKRQTKRSVVAFLLKSTSPKTSLTYDAFTFRVLTCKLWITIVLEFSDFIEIRVV